MFRSSFLSIIHPEHFAMSDSPQSADNLPEQESKSLTPAVILAYGLAAIYLSVPVSLIFDEVIFRTYYLSRTFPQLQNPVRILYFPFMWVGYWLGLVPWSPPSF